MDSTKAALSALAVRELSKRDVCYLGIGSGTTIGFFIEELGQSSREFIIIPTSIDTEIRVSSKQFCQKIESAEISPDLAVDGADEVEQSTKWILKGGGGALTREKIVAYSAKEFWILADSSKIVEKLGLARPVPIEVLPFGWKRTKHLIERLGGTCQLRQATGKLGPVITDNGNYLLDFQSNCDWNPKEMENDLNQIPGVVENGIFTRIPDKLFVAEIKTAKILTFEAEQFLSRIR
ncbi:MAG: ribose 5-phosphate isomerase A [Candidatus Hodarchaeota archaeon]